MDVLLTHHILLAVCIGFVVDCIVGDPEKLPHPVRWMGALITVLERRLRRETDAPRKQQAKGALLVLCVCLVTAALSALAVWAAGAAAASVPVIPVPIKRTPIRPKAVIIFAFLFILHYLFLSYSNGDS